MGELFLLIVTKENNMSTESFRYLRTHREILRKLKLKSKSSRSLAKLVKITPKELFGGFSNTLFTLPNRPLASFFNQ